jgi:F-type H+-transporting ATPase subunit gamma
VAGGQERALRRRIRSVQSTKKITRAMELIAASQIVRAQGRIATNRPYRHGMARIVVEAALGDPEAAAKLLGTPASPRLVAVLAIVADRGLCGAYNSSVLRATERLVSGLRLGGTEVRLFVVGRKGPPYLRFRGYTVERSFTGFTDRPTFADARRVAAALSTPFTSGEVDQVLMVSTRFHSAGIQRVETEQLLPIPDPTGGNGGAETSAGDGGRPAGEGDRPTGESDRPAYAGPPVPEIPPREGYTEFEPDVETLLNSLAPRAVESEVFSALLQGSASFFTAQQRAMASATENADDLITTLTRVMNRARQDAITTEIMEIVGGAEALRQTKGAEV